MAEIIELTELQQDLLTELFNLGVGRAAASLSQMVKQEIILSVPRIELLTIDELSNKLGSDVSMCSVSQLMVGPFSVQSKLFFTEADSLEVVRQLLGKNLPEDTILELQQEAFSEIGNIVLNACIGSFSNALDADFQVDLPVYELAKSEELFASDKTINDTALFIRINLTLRESNISGYLAFLMVDMSLQQLKEILNKMLSSL